MTTLTAFKGATALITGASSGIGMGFAKHLAAHGIHLVITARSEPALQRLATELRHLHSVEVDVIAMDLSEPDAPQRLFEQLHDKPVDILINNAGFGKWANFLEESPANYHNMLSLNVQSLVALTQLFVPGMLQQRKGIVINVASTAAFQPLPYIAVYGASKAFVLHFTEAIAGEYPGQGVQFLALCPGNTATNFAQVANADTSGMGVSSVDDVVHAAIRALDNNKRYCVPGTGNYWTAQLSRFMTRSGMVKMVANMLKQRVQNTSTQQLTQ
jgi:short-subunit dehydrogenase